MLRSYYTPQVSPYTKHVYANVLHLQSRVGNPFSKYQQIQDTETVM